MKLFQKIIVVATIAALTSCSAIQTSISKRNLDVQTKMSNSVFLDPVPENLRTVYVQIRNTSDKSDFNIEQAVKEKVAARGYRITNNPDKAHYILQANILQVGKSSETAAEKSLFGGYGEALAGGAAAGYAANRMSAGSGGATVAGALIGAGVTLIADSLVTDVYYSVITDLQISERTRNGVQVMNQSKHNLAQGSSGSTKSTFKETTNLKRYQTRILSSANKANLKWEEASPELVKGLASSIGGMF